MKPIHPSSTRPGMFRSWWQVFEFGLAVAMFATVAWRCAEWVLR